MTDDVDVPRRLEDIAKAVDGKIESIDICPDGHGNAVISYPLPKDHWLTRPGSNEPPMPLRVGTMDAPRLGMTRKMWADAIKEAAKYAVRASTENGKIDDFDPDAMVRNFIIGMIGFYTPNGKYEL